MAQFEGYERREAKILGVLKEYGISSIDACKDICAARGIDPYTIVTETQPICFENAKWAYTVGAAIAIKVAEQTGDKTILFTWEGAESTAAYRVFEVVGSVEKLNGQTFLFKADVYDAMEMLPWIRTFTGRITNLTSTNSTMVETFSEDLKAMQFMYGGDENAVQ